jgi:hypothetical protein
MSTNTGAKPAQDTPQAVEVNVEQQQAKAAELADTLYPTTKEAKADPKDPVKADSEKESKVESKPAEKPAEKSPEKESPKKEDPKPEEKKEENKEADEKSKDEKKDVPEKYELKLPKDSLLDPKRMEKIASFAKEQGFSQAQAQALLDRESDAVSSYAASQKESLSQKATEWIKEVEGDKELGGQNYKQSLENAKRAIDRFGSETLKKQLNETGLGNHPELVRAFARIGKEIAEDKAVLKGSREQKNRSIESLLYGDSNS